MIKDSVLIDFIMDNHSPYRAKLTLEAIEGVLAYNVLDIVPRLEEIILNDDLDNMTRVEQVKMQIVSVIKEILHYIGITPYQEIPDFVKISKIINALDKCVHEYYPDYILDNTELNIREESDISKLYSLVHLIEGQSELDYYDVVHSVDDAVILDILQVLNSKVVPEFETDNPEILQRYKAFIKGAAKGVVREYIATGGRIGEVDPSALLTLFSTAILESAVPDRPFDIVSAILISDLTDVDQMGKTLTEWIDYFSDTEQERAFIEREVFRLYG